MKEKENKRNKKILILLLKFGQIYIPLKVSTKTGTNKKDGS